jgi:hypothetical protein
MTSDKQLSLKIPPEFSAYFELPDAKKKDAIHNGTIVFDTSALLGLYRIEPNKRTEILNELKSRLKGRVWLPHQVFLEFFRHREGEVEKDRQRVKKIKEAIEQKISAVEIEIATQNLDQLDPEFNPVHFSNELGKIKLAIEQSIKRVEKQYPDLAARDMVVAEILEMIGIDTVEGFSAQEDVDALAALGRVRFDKKIPPGFLDDKKDGFVTHKGLEIPRKYGDWFVWKQLLDAVKKDTKKFSQIIFVTQDQKADWWIVNPSNSGEIMGPRLELRQEIEAAGATTYWQYTFTQFYQHLVADDRPMTASQTAQLEEIANAERQLQISALARSRRSSKYLDIDDHIRHKYWKWREGDHEATQPRQDTLIPSEEFYESSAEYELPPKEVVRQWLRQIAPNTRITNSYGVPDLWIQSIGAVDDTTVARRIGIEIVSPPDPQTAFTYVASLAKHASIERDTLRLYFLYALTEANMEKYHITSWQETFSEIQEVISNHPRQRLIVGVIKNNWFEDFSSLFRVRDSSLSIDLARISR